MELPGDSAPFNSSPFLRLHKEVGTEGQMVRWSTLAVKLSE